jgi:hypothetical protein
MKHPLGGTATSVEIDFIPTRSIHHVGSATSQQFSS